MAKFIPPKATEAEAHSITPDEGELIYDETGRVLRMGDGVTPGGNKLQGLGNVASPSANGLMSAADKVKLDGLGENATQAASGLMSKEDKTKLDGLGGVATQSASGLMSAADKAKLDGLGGVATQSANGLMSAADKTKLDAMENLDSISDQIDRIRDLDWDNRQLIALNTLYEVTKPGIVCAGIKVGTTGGGASMTIRAYISDTDLILDSLYLEYPNTGIFVSAEIPANVTTFKVEANGSINDLYQKLFIPFK